MKLSKGSLFVKEAKKLFIKNTGKDPGGMVTKEYGFMKWVDIKNTINDRQKEVHDKMNDMKKELERK